MVYFCEAITHLFAQSKYVFLSILTMKRLILPFQWLYNFWTLFNFSWLMLICVPLVCFCIMVNEKIGGRIGFLFIKFWAATFSALSLIFYKTKGREHLEKGKAYIFVANHRSYLDSPALVLTIPQQCRALGKVEILKYPVFGIMFRYVGVTVDRSNPESRRKSLELVKEKLMMGINIMIFPEGTMNKSQDTLLPFKDGAFRLAVETGASIVPVAIHNAGHILPRDSADLKAGTITVEFGKPITANSSDFQEIDQLKNQTAELLKNMLEKKGG